MKMDFTMIRKALLIIEENEPCSHDVLSSLELPKEELIILLNNFRDAGYVEYRDISDSRGFDIMGMYLLPAGRNALDFLRCDKWFCKTMRYLVVRVGLSLLSIEYKKPELFRVRH